MLELLFIHAFFLIAANGSWVNYFDPCLSRNYTNGSILTCVYSTDTQNFPSFFLYIYIVLMIVYFFLFATNRSRRAFIGVAFLSLLTAIIMAGAGMVDPVIVSISWGLFISITAIILVLGN